MATLSVPNFFQRVSGKGRGPYLKRAQQAFVHAHHGSGVVEFSTVIGSAEQCDELSFGEELITVLHNLMCSTDQVHVVFGQEPRHHVGTEGKGDASIVFAPASDVLVRIGPQQVAE
jgi:hypothetical protein